MAKAKHLLTFRVDLVRAKPPIWRRLQLRSDLTLLAFHKVLQTAFRWYGGHLWCFEIGGEKYELPHDYGADGIDPRDVTLGRAFAGGVTTASYLYDFGDDWTHRIKLESTEAATAESPRAWCTGGKQVAPPDDIGGIYVWRDYLQAVKSGDKSGFKDMPELWDAMEMEQELGFDVGRVNERLAQ